MALVGFDVVHDVLVLCRNSRHSIIELLDLSLNTVLSVIFRRRALLLFAVFLVDHFCTGLRWINCEFMLDC